MILSNLVKLVEGDVLAGSDNLGIDIKGAFAADLMSDVLTSTLPDGVLLTGLCNPQVVRTALCADVRAIVLVRGKEPNQELIEIAGQHEIPLISSSLGMYEICGRLFQWGLPSLETNIKSLLDE